MFALGVVMRGHSPLKTGVNALMTRASIIFAKSDGLPGLAAERRPGNDGWC
jgi:hypothetical protein